MCYTGLAIAKFADFKPKTKILDLGTGGGFPGIPLAIFFPECHFTLVDSIRKKNTCGRRYFRKHWLNQYRFCDRQGRNAKRKIRFCGE
jgi:16S rRNA (guanine527-N7)-methyltransferase